MRGEELQALLLRSRAGDLEAFTRIVEHYQKPLSRYLLHIVGDTGMAEDLTQDTFIELFESLRRQDASRLQQLEGWLHRAATNNALSALRRRRRFAWLPLDWFHSSRADSRSVENQVAERDRVRQALTSLPARQAVCLLLHDAVGLKCLEIAEQQGISLDAAKQRLARARRGFIAAYREDPRDGGGACGTSTSDVAQVASSVEEITEP